MRLARACFLIASTTGVVACSGSRTPDAAVDVSTGVDAMSDALSLPDATDTLDVTDAAPSDASTTANPLGLTPGVAVTRPLGPIAVPTAFDLTVASDDIDYGVNLATENYAVRLPAHFDPNDPTRHYGLITWIDFADTHAVPASYTDALDAHDIIWIGGQGIGNTQATSLRMGVALLGALRMIELYNIDLSRVYVSGISGGSRTAGGLGYLRHDVFRGFIGRVGAALPSIIPGWQTAGSDPTTVDGDYEAMFASTPESVVLPTHFRTVLMTQYGDFRRSENTAIYRYGHMNHGNAVRMVMRPGGHPDEVGPSFTDALSFLYHPAIDVIWDRFEDTNVATNTDPGRTAAGTGFTVRNGSVAEVQNTYNGNTLGVLALTGAGASVEARETFTWQDPSGIVLDARLRAETAVGNNQEIGVHIIPAGSTAPAVTQPGLHLYWSYGRAYHLDLVGADGANHTLATWTFPGTHPMNLATTALSPQAGEGVVTEKTFWDATAAPDFAGEMLRFRGEDVRVVLNSVGFQLTFNRPAGSFASTYPGVTLQTAADGEELPIVLQGFWSETETSTVSLLPSGRYRLVITNDAINTAMPAGNALVDEIHLVGTVGSPAAPPTLTAVSAALTWTEVSGAASYQVFRATAATGPFAMVGTTPGYEHGYTDTGAVTGTTYWWQVAAVGADGTVGGRSPVAMGMP